MTSYITKALRKAIMKRSYLENLYFKKRSPESMKKYKKQKNICSKLYKKERRRYFESLDPSKIVDDKTFWKNIQPLFSEKRKTATKVTFVHKEDKIISENSLVSEEINFFFQNATKKLDINENSYIKDETNEYTDTVEKAIYKYVNHPSILLTRGATTFLFKEASTEDIEKEMLHLNPKKNGYVSRYTSKDFKEYDKCLLWLNDTVIHCEFLNELKKADVTPIFKKDDPTKAKNYRPVSVLPVVSKVFERIMHKQISEYINQFLSPYLLTRF